MTSRWYLVSAIVVLAAASAPAVARAGQAPSASGHWTGC